MFSNKRTQYSQIMSKKRKNRPSNPSMCTSSSPPIRGKIDPFDPRYAHVPLDVPVSHVEDYVKRKNNRNDQDHLQTQIKYFKKEFGCLPAMKASTNNTANSNNNNNSNNADNTNMSSTTNSSSTNHMATSSTQIEMSTNISSTQTQNDDHKDDDTNDDEQHRSHHNNHNSAMYHRNLSNMHRHPELMLPPYDSLSSIRSALARYEAWQFTNNYNHHRMTSSHPHLDDFNDEFPSSHAQPHRNSNSNAQSQYQYVAPFYNPFLRINIANATRGSEHSSSSKMETELDDDEDIKEVLDEVNHALDEQEDDEDNDLFNLTPHNTVFPLSHYEQNRLRNTNIDLTHTLNTDITMRDSQCRHSNHNRRRNESIAQQMAHTNDRYQRYKQYQRCRHSFRALQYHHSIRRRLVNVNRRQMTDHAHINSPYYLMSQFEFDQTDTMNNYRNINQSVSNYTANTNSSHPHMQHYDHNWSRISNILSLNATLSEDDEHASMNQNHICRQMQNENENRSHMHQNNVKLKVISPKLKHHTTSSSSSRLEGLSDFKAAVALIPLRLTSMNPFKQTIYKTKRRYKKQSKREMDDCDADGDDRMRSRKVPPNDGDVYMTPMRRVVSSSASTHDKIVISAIDRSQNLLAQLSSDLHLIVLNMLTGLGNVRTMALYKSLRSDLTEFDIDRIRNCSVYKCQALFVERYRQSLFDEKYKALQQPALTRALSSAPKNLSEFQQCRQAQMALRRQTSVIMDDDEKSHPM